MFLWAIGRYSSLPNIRAIAVASIQAASSAPKTRKTKVVTKPVLGVAITSNSAAMTDMPTNVAVAQMPDPMGKGSDDCCGYI